MEFRAVIFDWRGTLVVMQDARQWVGDAFRRMGESPTPEVVDEVIHAIRLANGPENRLDAPGLDTDPVQHRTAFMKVFHDAEIHDGLADALYASESDFHRNPFAVDVAPTLRALKSAGLSVAILSDIHFDIRPAFVEQDLSQFINGFVLSFEIHAQKPDLATYSAALATVGCSAEDTLMVGDRSVPDGGAVEHGITTLLLPTLKNSSERRLRRVLSVCRLLT